jgi:hypothetical protein
VPERGQLGLAVIAQPVLVDAHRAGTGLLVELPRCRHGSSLCLIRSLSWTQSAVQYPRHQKGQQHQPNERTAACTASPSDLMGKDRQRGLIRVVFSVTMPVSDAITLACLVVRFAPRDAAEDHQ